MKCEINRNKIPKNNQIFGKYDIYEYYMNHNSKSNKLREKNHTE